MGRVGTRRALFWAIRWLRDRLRLETNDLLLLEKAGEVKAIRTQVLYKLAVNEQLICKYFADFVYDELRDGRWREVVEDVKGYRTQVYRLKKKLMQACHGVEIREI